MMIIPQHRAVVVSYSVVPTLYLCTVSLTLADSSLTKAKTVAIQTHTNNENKIPYDKLINMPIDSRNMHTVHSVKSTILRQNLFANG